MDTLPFLAIPLLIVTLLWLDFRRGLKRPPAQHEHRPTLSIANVRPGEVVPVDGDPRDYRLARWTPERGAELYVDGRWQRRDELEVG